MAYTTTQKPTEYLFYMHVHKKAMYLGEGQMQLHLEIISYVHGNTDPVLDIQMFT